MEQKEYKCICGKICYSPASFNGHKQGCKVHLAEKYGSYENYLKIKNRSRETAHKSLIKFHENKRLLDLEKWISEKHTCEKCGKVMTEKYGSGRFCSKSCANSRTFTSACKNQISDSIKISASKKDYIKRYCEVCGKELKRGSIRKSCSDLCKKELLRRNAIKNNFGGPSKTSSYGKRGTYHGIHCDSTYELAFLIYCLDHSIKIIRNEEKFPYVYGNKQCNYYPDFYLPEYDTFIETKGRDIGPVYEKIQAVVDAGRKIKILHYEDLTECFSYIVSTYPVNCNVSNNTIYKLYDDYVET